MPFAERECGKERNTVVEVMEVNLDGNTIGVDGARGLGTALAASSTLTSLSLEYCSISGAGCCALSEGVGRSASLTNLQLGGNNFGQDGARGLGVVTDLPETR